MLIGSWNVNSIGVRSARVLALLKKYRPDALLLQELKCTDEAFPWELFQKQGWNAAVFGQKTYNGVAVLSRHPIENIRKGFDDGDPDTAARFILVEIQGFQVASAYVPNGQAVGTDKYQYKLAWLSRLQNFLKRELSPTSSFVLGGDFNVAREDRDVHDPSLWRGQVLFSDAERTALSDVLAWGLEDTFRKHHAEGGFYTWWDYRAGAFHRNHGLRIDYLFSTSSLYKKCQRTEIIRDERKGEKPSDHVPVFAEF